MIPSFSEYFYSLLAEANTKKPIALRDTPEQLVGKFKPEDIPTLQRIAQKIGEAAILKSSIHQGSTGISWGAWHKRIDNIDSALGVIFSNPQRYPDGYKDLDIAKDWLRDSYMETNK